MKNLLVYVKVKNIYLKTLRLYVNKSPFCSFGAGNLYLWSVECGHDPVKKLIYEVSNLKKCIGLLTGLP
jgi:hypothetical protein